MTKKEHLLQSSTKIQETEQMSELSEDMELISPGSMLREARERLSLSQDDIANKLNFRLSLVDNIEQDIFDTKLPITFHRGYLANYAKLVSLDVEEVLASYDVLGDAHIQRSELQSFSKQTVKEAEHSRVMWLSYLILIVLVGLTALWWQQDNQMPSLVSDSAVTGIKADSNNEALQIKPLVADNSGESSVKGDSEGDKEVIHNIDRINENSNLVSDNQPLTVISTPPAEQVKQVEIVQSQTLLEEKTQVESPLISHAVFTFSGDCWVNIYDATGERIAWGIKKSGYVMSIEGVAPLRITLGKPELASIVFNEQPVDMSAFNRGNIAKFTLPLTP